MLKLKHILLSKISRSLIVEDLSNSTAPDFGVDMWSYT